MLTPQGAPPSEGNIMRRLSTTLVGMAMLFTAGSGFAEEGKAETAGKKVDEAAQDTKAAAKRTSRKIKRGAKKAKQKAGEAVEDAGKKMQE